MDVESEMMNVIKDFAKPVTVHYVIYHICNVDDTLNAHIEAHIYKTNKAVEVRLKGKFGPFPVSSPKSLVSYLRGPTTDSVGHDMLVIQFVGNQNVPNTFTLPTGTSWSEVVQSTFNEETFYDFFSLDNEFTEDDFYDETKLFRDTMLKLGRHAWNCLVG